MFDPPHLLKCVRNNLLDAKAKFFWPAVQEGEQTAAWKDVVSMYELDVDDYDFRMLNKLTDNHVYADKIKKMKVSIAAQVFSQRVSAIMRGFVKHAEGIFLLFLICTLQMVFTLQKLRTYFDVYR